MTKFFTNKTTLDVFTWLAVIFSTIQAAMCIKAENYLLSFELFVNLICVICLWLAFAKFETKSVRGIIGAILMLFLIRYATVFIDYVQAGSYNGINAITALITPILIAVVMFNHFLLSATHHSSPGKMKFNQIMLAIMLIYIVLRHIYMICFTKEMFDKLSYVVAIFSFICTFGVIICIVAQNDAYRRRKESGELTEEDKNWKKK